MQKANKNIEPLFYCYQQNNNFINNYSLNTQLNSKTSGGTFELTLNNIKYENNDDINSSARLNVRQVLDRNKIVYFEGLITNSVSTTRSLNERSERHTSELQ